MIIFIDSIPLALATLDSLQQGRLNVYRNGAWGTICSTGFTANVAIVACRQLGLGNYGISTVTGRSMVKVG